MRPDRVIRKRKPNLLFRKGSTLRRSTRRRWLEYGLIHIKRVTDHSLSNDLLTGRSRPNFNTLDCLPAQRNGGPTANYSGSLQGARPKPLLPAEFSHWPKRFG